VAVTATFRMFYVLVLIEHGSRRLLHFNITQHPTAAWTLQQLREAFGCVDGFQYLLHDRDSIFAPNLDASISRLGLKVLKSPPHSPKVKELVSYCTSLESLRSDSVRRFNITPTLTFDDAAIAR
jgi:putative transposase